MEPNTWTELLKLAIFSIFVTAVVEVLKAIASTLERTLTTKHMQLLTFGVALYICYGLDYGILHRVIEVGANVREKQAMWIDYVGTAGVVMMGANWVFDKFAAAIATARATRVKAENGG